MTSPRSSYLKLKTNQRIYVDGILAGLSKGAASSAAGHQAGHFDRSEAVQNALLERMQQTADEVDFGRREAHDMYMDAYRNADTSTEQVAAINAMVKLHGLEKPKVIEHKHEVEHSGQLEFMPTDKLMALAGMEDLVLEGEFEEVEDAPQLVAPEVTDDNTAEELAEVPTVSQDY